SFFFKSPIGFMLNRTIANNPTPPTVNLSAGQIYFLSSWTPTVDPYPYEYLVGGSAGSPLPNQRTYVWLWNATTQNCGAVYRYKGVSWTKLPYPSPWTPAAAPSIPSWEGAAVAYFAPDPASVLQSVQVVQAPAPCPANVTLTLTFSPPLD